MSSTADISIDSMAMIPEQKVRLDLHNPLSRGYDRGRPLWYIVLWDLVQTWLIRPSPHFAMGWRRFIYRLFGAKVGRGVRIGHSTITHYPWKLCLRYHVWIGDEVHLYSMDHITIEDNAVVSQRAYVCTGSHDPSDPTFPVITKPITIRTGAWIALGAVIMPGVTVEEGALIGVGAILTKKAEAWGIYLGVPAVYKGKRIIKSSTTTPSPGLDATIKPSAKSPYNADTALADQRPGSNWPNPNPSQPAPPRVTPSSLA